MYNQKLVEFIDVSKEFDNVVALNKVNFKVTSGVYGLLGPNGAGKTTAINLICGFIKPSFGMVRIFGLDPWIDRDVIFTKVSVMPDEITLPKDIPGYRVLLHEARLLDLSNPEKRVGEVSKILGIDWALDRPVYSYSSGMYKRLLLSRVILNPYSELIILDEPFSNIDIYTMLDFIDLIRQLSKEGKSFIISSHIFPLISNLCDKYIFLDKGRVVFKGDFERLKSQLNRISYLVRIRGDSRNFLRYIKSSCRIDECEVVEEGIILHVRVDEKFIDCLVEISRELGVDLLEVRIEPDLITQAFRKVISSEDTAQ